jgi:HD-like signal output (HDOD) protein
MPDVVLNIEKVIADLEELPALPTTVMKVVNLTQSETSSAGDLAKIISMDQSLTTSVLKLCNSPFYGLQRKVDSVQQAVALVGFEAVKGLVVSISVKDTFNKSTDGYLMEEGELWRSGIACGFLAQKIAFEADPSLKDVAFTAGIIRDIGKVVCNKYLLSDFSRIMELAQSEKINFNQAEKKVLGFDHGDIGGRVAKKWSFPTHLTDAILNHHAPANSDAKSRKLTNMVHIADVICLTMGIGVGGDGLYYEMDAEAAKMLKIDEEKMENLMGFLLDSMDKIEVFLQ